MCFVAKYSYKILADIRQNLLEVKVCFVSSHGNMQLQFLQFILNLHRALHSNTSKVYKMNTFSLNSVLQKTFNLICSFDPQNAFSCSSSTRPFFAFLIGKIAADESTELMFC